MFNVQEAFQEMAKGDKDAVEFLNAFYLWCHSRDDLIDQDKPIVVSAVVGFDLLLMRTFAKNLFFQKNVDFLMPVILASALAYIASEDRKKSEDVLERITAQVLKSQYLDVFLSVSLLVGGFEHGVAMSRKYREYSFDDEKSV